eukprot:EG_transcript_13653
MHPGGAAEHRGRDGRPGADLEAPPSPGTPKKAKEVRIWGLIDISHLSPVAQFTVCLLGLLVFYIAYGLLQELVTTEFKRHKKRLGWFMTTVQFSTAVVVSSVQRRSAKGFHSHHHKLDVPVPRSLYVAIGCLAVLSMGLSNVSCELLNYSTQVMFKSSKLIPVMIIGVLVLRKKYRLLTYCASVLISMGLAALAVADQQASPHFEGLGVLLVCLSVFAGASVGNLQEYIFRTYRPSETEVLLSTKLWGFVFVLGITTLTGQLSVGVSYAYDKPWAVVHMMALAITSVLGEYFGMLLTSLFGVLVAVTAGSCRKALTLYLSLLAFPKPFTLLHFFGTVGIFSGILLNVYVQNTKDVHDQLAALRLWLRLHLAGALLSPSKEMHELV